MTARAMKMAALALLFQAMLSVTALAQDFGSLVASATAANQQFVQQTRFALEAQDLATLQARAATAVATGEQARSLLSEALSLAPDDASRSRVEGVLTHITAAVEAGRAALQATNFGAARGFVDAMRGEAEEALAELPPLAPRAGPSAPAPVELPLAGERPFGAGFGDLTAIPLALAGLVAALAGLRLRKGFA